MKKLFLFLLLLPFTCLAQQPEPIKPEYIQVGKSKDEFVEWAKSVSKYYSNDFQYNSESLESKKWWDYIYTLRDGSIMGPLENPVKYQYIFKNDTCRWVQIVPGSLIDLENRMKAFKKQDDGTYMMGGEVKIIINEKKGKLQAEAL